MAKQGIFGRKNLFWKEYFREPSQNKLSYESMWLQPSSHNPCWVHQEMKRRSQEKHGKEMSHGIQKEYYTFIDSLKACAKKKNLCEGTKLHADLLENGLLEKCPYIASALIHMYCKCGVLSEAQKVLEKLQFRDVVTWSALISGYAQHGQGHIALHCFEKMQKEGIHPDEITFSCILKACGITGALNKGEIIHEEIARRGFLEKNIVLGNALVDMYAKCGNLEKAQKVLEDLPFRDVISWNSLISGYAQHGQGYESLYCFEKMQREGISPNLVTFICILQGCGSLRDVKYGIKIHEEIMSRGLLGKDIVLGTALVDMYVKCGMLTKAKEVLEELPNRNAVCWNALITGYVHEGMFRETLLCFDQMRSEGLGPDPVTCICILKACANTRAIDKGKQIHDHIANRGWLEKDIVLSTALVDMYSKCSMLSKARETLKELHIRDVVSWNALIDGYAEQGQCHEALDCVRLMKMEGASPNAITFTCILKACAKTGSTEKGKQIHNEIESMGLLMKDSSLGTALVDMYAKCGMLAKAQEVLEKLPLRSQVSWSALIAGYAQQGQGKKALQCFKQMQNEGFFPNAVTILSVLSACSHSGLLDEAQMVFGDMTKKYGISPTLEHHTCMVLVFGCAGEFDKATSVIQVMPVLSDTAVWLALLGSCRKWGNVELGTLAFDQTLQLEKTCGAAYVLMANIFAAAGMQKDAESVEAMRLKYADWKVQGNSMWVDASGIVHSFSCRGRKHAQIKEMYAKFEAISLKLSQEGYLPSMLGVLENTYNDGPCDHSGRLAIACALINTVQEETIHVTTNKALCDECHIAASLISKIEKRKLMIQDPNNLHVFQNKEC